MKRRNAAKLSRTLADETRHRRPLSPALGHAPFGRSEFLKTGQHRFEPPLQKSAPPCRKMARGPNLPQSQRAPQSALSRQNQSPPLRGLRAGEGFPHPPTPAPLLTIPGGGKEVGRGGVGGWCGGGVSRCKHPSRAGGPGNAEFRRKTKFPGRQNAVQSGTCRFPD